MLLETLVRSHAVAIVRRCPATPACSLPSCHSDASPATPKTACCASSCPDGELQTPAVTSSEEHGWPRIRYTAQNQKMLPSSDQPGKPLSDQLVQQTTTMGLASTIARD
eukprot:8254767-Lingulodinium_polyedra.AAC.1